MDATPPAHPAPLEYFGPTVYIPPARRFGSWREGRVLAMFEGSAIPDGCIRCGGQSAACVGVRLPFLPEHMRSAASFLFIFLGFAHRVRVEVGLCARCQTRTGESTRIGAYLVFLAVALAGMAVWERSEDLVAGASAAGIAGIAL